jgi:hypothetical protein
MMESKEQIEAVRAQGMNVFPGMKVPEKTDDAVWQAMNMKSRNEASMQKILNDTVHRGNIKMKFYPAFTDAILTSAAYGKVEKDLDGRTTFRPIPINLAMFEEAVNDELCLSSPYKGEIRPMYYHEIINTFNLNKEQAAKLKEVVDNPSEYLNPSDFTNYENGLLINTYTIQVKVPELVVIKKSVNPNTGRKYSTFISADYKKNGEKIDKEVSAGKYNIEKFYKESMLCVTRIGKDMYVKYGYDENIIQSRTNTGKYRTEYDYCNLVYGTVNGTRISIYELTVELSRTYNIIRFMINREISKLKGKTFTYDEAYLPKGKSTVDVMYRLTEDGVLTYNSAQAGVNEGEERRMTDAFKELDLGVSQGLQTLIILGQDIERVIDRITGINENRQGLNKASATATGIEMSVEASRSITYPLYYFFNIFQNHVFTKICEKKKADIIANKDNSDGEMIIGANGVSEFIKYGDMGFDDYVAYVTNGKKLRDLKERNRALYLQQVNAGELRAQDIVRAEMQETYAEYLAVLDNAWNELNEMRRKIEEEKSKGAQAMQTEALQQQNNLHEDDQRHDLDVIQFQGEINKEIQMLKNSGKIQDTSAKGSFDLRKASMVGKPLNEPPVV